MFNRFEDNLYFDELSAAAKPAPEAWAGSSIHTECTLHQLSPYIGKLKSIIARDLITRFSNEGDLVVDPFVGSGTVSLEAAILGRNVFAADASPYAIVLTNAKLFSPPNLETAIQQAEMLLLKALNLPTPNLDAVPVWVQRFFHPKTLAETLNFSTVLKEESNSFLMACFLGILHHQRPGFLSYPSSHLVPYLRNQKYPRDQFPELYEYRSLRPRMLAKITRAYKRYTRDFTKTLNVRCMKSKIQALVFPDKIDCLITSPPYMNALDYGRDNRLRFWFLDEGEHSNLDQETGKIDGYCQAIESLADQLEAKLRTGGNAVFVIGEKDARGTKNYSAAILAKIMKEKAPSLTLKEIIGDGIPDIRRSRRRLSGIKKEHILIYRRE